MFLRVLPFYDLRYREDFSKGASLESLVSSLLSTGFQATNVGLAIHEINRMVSGKSYHFKLSLQVHLNSTLLPLTTTHYLHSLSGGSLIVLLQRMRMNFSKTWRSEERRNVRFSFRTPVI